MFENARLSPAFLIRPSGPPYPRGKGSSKLLPSVGVRWEMEGLGRCGHRPLRNGGGTDLYRKSAYCPHSSSAPTYSLFTITYYFKLPRGKGSSYCFLLLGCGGMRWVWADVPQSAPTKRWRHVPVPQIGFSPAFLIRPYLFTIHYYLLLLDWGVGIGDSILGDFAGEDD